MTPGDLLARLRDPSDGAPAARLAAVLVDEALARPLAALVRPGLLVAAARDVMAALAASEGASARALAELELARAALGSLGGPVGGLVPAPARGALHAIAALPLVARRGAVLQLLDRPTLRQLLRAQIVHTLSDFGRKVASPVADSSLARGLGGLGKLAGQIARPGPLGALASAVSSEVERQVERRASDFADTAVAGLLAGIADEVSDAARASQQAALREELLEGLLAVEGADVAALLEGSAREQVAIARKALGAMAADAALAAGAEALLSVLVARVGERPLGEILADLGLREPVERHARAVARAALADLTGSPAFAGWLEHLAGAP